MSLGTYSMVKTVLYYWSELSRHSHSNLSYKIFRNQAMLPRGDTLMHLGEILGAGRETKYVIGVTNETPNLLIIVDRPSLRVLAPQQGFTDSTLWVDIVRCCDRHLRWIL